MTCIVCSGCKYRRWQAAENTENTGWEKPSRFGNSSDLHSRKAKSSTKFQLSKLQEVATVGEGGGEVLRESFRRVIKVSKTIFNNSASKWEMNREKVTANSDRELVIRLQLHAYA